MSTQEFKPGDRVRLKESGGTVSGHAGDAEFIVDIVAPSGRALILHGVAGARGADRFVKVEPEWVVGQQIDTDRDNVPVGTVVKCAEGHEYCAYPLVKTGDGVGPWVEDERGSTFQTLGTAYTIVSLPDATEPEDATDAYVEPEPDHVAANAVQDLAQALIWTREYVGEDKLP
ncbi:MAG: hypothetical protein ACRDTJ_03875, partial [Pseudonocardiaceae bacterium]